MMAPDLALARWVGAFFAPWQRRAAVRSPELQTKPLTIITGASGGLGSAIAHELGRAGDHLLLIGRDEARLAALASEVGLVSSGEVHVYVQDFEAEDCASKLEAEVSRLGFHAARLINNAGLGERDEFLDMDEAGLDALLKVNVRALTVLTRQFLPGMVARGDGAILNMASVGGLAPAPYQSVYYASKAYVINFSEALAHEIRGRGVYIAAVCPGPAKTDFHKKIKARRALYQVIVGKIAPRRVARSVHRALLMRHWALVTPGLITPFLGFALRVIPGSLMAPFMGVLFKKW